MPEKENDETFEEFDYVEKTFLDFKEPVRFQFLSVPKRGKNSFGRQCWTALVMNLDTGQDYEVDLTDKLIGSIKKALMGSDPLTVGFAVERIGEGYNTAYEVELEKQIPLQSRI